MSSRPGSPAEPLGEPGAALVVVEFHDEAVVVDVGDLGAIGAHQERFGEAHNLFRGRGIFSPHEALAAVETLLRLRGKYYVRVDSRGSSQVDATLFFAGLRRSLVPKLSEAIDSLTHPATQPTTNTDGSLRVLTAMASRFEALLVARDRLMLLNLLEAYDHASNNLRSEQAYHVHHSVALAGGILDGLVRLIRVVDGISDGKTTWHVATIPNPPNWTARLSSAQTQEMWRAVRKLGSSADLRLLYDLRQRQAHDQEVIVAIAEIQGTDRHTQARAAVVDLTDAAGETHEYRGTFEHGPRTFAFPHMFVNAAIQALASAANKAIGAAEWENANWVGLAEIEFNRHSVKVRPGCDSPTSRRRT